MSKTPRSGARPHERRQQWAPGADVLADAARVLSRVAHQGRSFEDALNAAGRAAERSAVRAVALGSIRWYLRLLPAVESLLERPEGVPREIRALLIATAHQIEYSRNAPQASVHAAVDAARILGQPRATGLVNAVLRRFLAERAELLARVDQDLASRTAHPRWLVEELTRAWPERVESVLEANNAHPPMVLRVDTTRTSVADYLAELAAAGMKAHAVHWAPAAVRLEVPVPVSDLPGFQDGRVSVQDAGAQLAAQLLDAREGMRVLDACAAPGGKTAHLLERTPGLAELVAVDIDAARVDLIRENLARLGRRATVLVGDVRAPETFWDGRPFDRILVDAPCSSTGVIRRHPDIKLLRRASDIPAMAELQLAILTQAFTLLAPGGRLVYGTCSVLPTENEQVVRAFLEREPRATTASPPVALPPGAELREPGFQLLPGSEAGTDGFYYACLENTTAGT